MPSLDALPTAKAQTILCGYRNATPVIHIIRITNIADWYFEQVVVPGAWLRIRVTLLRGCMRPRIDREVISQWVPQRSRIGIF